MALLWAKANARRLNQALPTDSSLDDVVALRTRLQGDRVVAVAIESDDRLVGCAFGTPLRLPAGEEADAAAHVSLVSVDPAHWGEGYGLAVVGLLERALSNAGYTDAQLHVLETNTRARRLYERSGWRLVRTGDVHDEGPQAVYQKDLLRAEAPT
jgi:ribosomal protein S18 acetylase RimI-like enzyme